MPDCTQKKFKKDQYMQELLKRVAGKNRTRVLGKKEEHDAAIRWLENCDEDARLLIIQSHAKLVAKEVSRMKNYRAEPADLFSEGMAGLSIALDKFDPYSGCRFSTYAIHWIRANMIGHVQATEGVMRISSTKRFKKLFFSYRRAMAQITNELALQGRHTTYAEVREIAAETLGVSVEDLMTVEAAMSHATSIDTPLNTSSDDDPMTLADILPDQSLSAEETIIQSQTDASLKSLTKAALDDLKPREKHIIKMRKLAPKDKVMTLEDLSGVYNVSRERVRQIEVAALRKLQTSLHPAKELLQAS
jgi:RNA polymerase sigma-32 factor